MDLISFVRLSESDKFLQEEISNCDNLQKFKKVLKKHECQFTIEEIASASRDLAASYWPWSQKDRQQRKDFFIREWIRLITQVIHGACEGSFLIGFARAKKSIFSTRWFKAIEQEKMKWKK